MYDVHSAKLLKMTDWRRHGAIKHPPASLRQWGRGLNDVELAALGQARMAAALAPQGSAPFWQFHPSDQRAHILCRADVIAAGGWEILLLDEHQNPTGWALKGDRGAELHCDCHCGWNPSCPGVVSVPAGSGPRPSPVAPSPALDPVSGADDMRWPSPAVQHASERQESASVPDSWRWPSSIPAASYAGESDRGELHAAHEYEQQHDHHLSEPVPPKRRGIFAALFGGAAAVPAVVEHAAGSEYRGELHGPEPAAIAHEWQWPDSLPGPAVESPLAIEHYAAPAALGWENSAGWAPDPYAHEPLSAPTAATAWDAPAASWEAALPPPDPLIALPTPDYSTPAEIDAFMDAVRDTAPPAILVELATQMPALPPPDGEER